MKKSLLFVIAILFGYIGTAQDCGSYIELIGSGITGQNAATILIEDLDQVDFISAEVIYKSTTEPTQVRFWSESEEIFAEPVDVPISGFQGEGVITSVFRANFIEPASEINLDILQNSTEFYSMAVYVHRKNGHTVSYMEGELYHVYQNEDLPLVTDIPVQKSDHPRDITLRFGISELNQDTRWAEFIFEADGETKSMEIWEWDTNEGETDSYTIREVKFVDVDGDIDQIKMTMLSENHETDALKGDSYIAGVVLVDIPCEYEESEAYCSYTQGYYGNKGGKTCKGESTRELLNKLLMEDLILGDGDYTFTIPAGGADCVLDILPGGGPSKALSGAYGCDNLGDIASKKGRLKNTLLAQGITLALNLRNSPNLMSFPVDGMDFETRETEDCSNPDAEGIHGTERSHAFGMDVVDYLGVDATISDLLYLVNSALAGYDITPLSLSNVADAAALVNEAFDECVLVIYPVETNPDEGDEGEDGDDGNDGEEDANGDQKGTTGVSDASFEEALKLYPNPTRNLITIQTQESGSYFIEISTLNGQLIHKSEFSGASYQTDLSSLENGVYFLKIRSENQLSTRKIVKQ